jgi:hypothetical protein
VSPIALALAQLRYEAFLENDLAQRYANGTDLARKVIKDIGAVDDDDVSKDQRNVILKYAREAIERNIREADFALLLGIAAVLLLSWKAIAGAAARLFRWSSRHAQYWKGVLPERIDGESCAS